MKRARAFFLSLLAAALSPETSAAPATLSWQNGESIPGELSEASAAEVTWKTPLFEEPLHPYTQGLLASLPRPDRKEKARLTTIAGIVPSILNMPPGCKFAQRCPLRIAKCDEVEPELLEITPGRFCRCHLVDGAQRANTDGKWGAAK